MGKKMFWAAVPLAVLGGCAGPSVKEQPKKEAAAPVIEVAPLPAKTGQTGGISGKATLQGTPPKARTLSMDATPVCAKMHKGPVLSEEAVVGKGGELKNAFVWIKRGVAPAEYPMPPAAKLDQNGCIYTPHVLGVMVNQKLEISNSDDTNHNIHPMPRVNREWNESQPPKGDAKIKSFDKEETPPILFKCNVHPWMRAWVGVVSHPYFAVTGDDGSFEIKDVPPGEYQLAAWHERFGTLEINMRVDAKQTPAVNLPFKVQ